MRRATFMADSVSVPGERSAVPGSLHCGGGKSSGGSGFFSCGMMKDSGCRKCFPMMFSRFILRTIKDGRIHLMLFVPSSRAASTHT